MKVEFLQFRRPLVGRVSCIMGIVIDCLLLEGQIEVDDPWLKLNLIFFLLISDEDDIFRLYVKMIELLPVIHQRKRKY